MAQSLFFYDLETSGLNPHSDRIMQFAGIRTDMELRPIGEPYNLLIQLPDDTLPSPEALMVTGITPQQTQADGYSEAEFAHILIEDICTPDTITVGFNNIRFDDEFIRAFLWRNFHDPYEWCWKNGCSRWDLLDVVRMTRALRPDGITWPVVDGVATNRLELLTQENGIGHTKAHDALSDVEALIDVTRLIKTKQPQLYQYLFTMRDKNKVKQLVNLEQPQPFVYTSGRYDANFHKTTVAYPLAPAKNGNVAVYDLRHDPIDFIRLSSDELKRRLYATREERQADGFVAVPIKQLSYNKAPAVAPTSVLGQSDGWQRLQLDSQTIERHRQALVAAPEFARRIASLFSQQREFAKSAEPEAQLYDGFVGDADRLRIEAVRKADTNQLAGLRPEFADSRLAPMLLHYKARNFPKSLSEDEAREWERFRSERVTRQLPGFMRSLQKLAVSGSDDSKQFILQELQLWAESIMPADIDDGADA